MLPRESRNPRGQRRARRQTDVSALESLEKRTLLSFSTLGYSLPDLTITGEAGPRAAWGGTIDVSVYLAQHRRQQHHRADVAVAADATAGGRIAVRIDQLSRCTRFHGRSLADQVSQVVERGGHPRDVRRAAADSEQRGAGQ